MRRIYIRIIGFIMCLPFMYALYVCYGISSSMLIPCVLGGSTLSPYVVAALAIGLYLIVTVGRKDE